MKQLALPSPIFTVTGTVDYRYTVANEFILLDKVNSIEASAEFPTIPEAKAFAAQFPKSWRVYGTCLYRGGGTLRGLVSIQAGLGECKSHGKQNETGLARVRKFLALVPHTFARREIGNYASEEQLRKVLAVQA